MKHSLPLILYLFWLSSANGQLVQGSVKNKNGKPIANASISVLNSYDGGVADSAGNFSFIHSVEINDTLEVTATGYNGYKKLLQPGTGSKNLNITLTEQITELSAVVVRSAGAFLAGNNKKGVVMSSLDIVTTAQNGDITTALKFLPGTQQVGEQEGLFVRGGTARETKQYMDGAIITNPYFKGAENFAQRGRYNPFLFNGTLFSTGAYSALYGDALSSVVLLNTVDLPERSDISFTLSPINLQAGTQQLSSNKKSSWGANYVFTAVAPYFKILKPKVEFFNGPSYQVGDINFRTKTKNGMLKFFASYGNNHVGMRTPDVDSVYFKDQVKVKNNNAYTNFNWQENLSHNWKFNWSNSFSINKDDVSGQVTDAHNRPQLFKPADFWMNAKNFAVVSKENNLQTRVVLEKRMQHLNAIRFGTEYNLFTTDVTYNQQVYSLKDNAAALFVETDKYFSNRLALTVGARAEYASVIDKMNMAPRASIVYRVGNRQQITGAYGLFYQKPESQFLLRNADLDFTKASHFLVNYTKATTGRILRVEAYYKDYKRLIKTLPLNFGNVTYNNNGKGYAEGLDVFWKDRETIKLFEYWVSYSYIQTKRDYLNYTQMLQPYYATPHTFSIVFKKFFMPIKTQCNLTYSYATGRPYYYFQQTQNAFLLKSEGKTIDYHNVGFSLNYVPFVGKENKKTHTLLVLTISNLLNTKQVYGYNYSYDGLQKQPILPATRQFFYLGLFINIGTNRTQQIINDNL